jgi:hypothetical protein
MKNGIYIVMIFTFFFSCKEQNQNNKTKTNTSNEANISSKDSIINLKIEKIDTVFISKNFKYKGKLKEALKWVDKFGKHIIFTCENFYYSDFVNETVNIEIDGKEEIIKQETFKQNAEIFCYHYKIEDNKYKLVWKIYDKSLKCPMDAIAFFINKSIEITDLNKNGIPEISTMYSVSCKGDVSPNELNLIMYEGDQKYKIQGTSLIDYIENEKYGGEIHQSDNFNNDKVLLNYALKKWRKNIKG